MKWLWVEEDNIASEEEEHAAVMCIGVFLCEGHRTGPLVFRWVVVGHVLECVSGWGCSVEGVVLCKRGACG